MTLLTALALLLATPGPTVAQDNNVIEPGAEIEGTIDDSAPYVRRVTQAWGHETSAHGIVYPLVLEEPQRLTLELHSHLFDAYLSLRRAFREAGSRTVVSTLWMVDDGAARALVGAFYANLWERGMPASQALREAQLELLRGGELAEPRHWAAFTLSGDWR